MLIIVIFNLLDQKHWPKIFLLTCSIFIYLFLFLLLLILFSLLLCCAYVVDIWAVGCIMAEMVRHKILFPGRDCILELLAAVSGSSYENETQTSIVSSKTLRTGIASCEPPQTFCFMNLPHTSTCNRPPAFHADAPIHMTYSPKQQNFCFKHETHMQNRNVCPTVAEKQTVKRYPCLMSNWFLYVFVASDKKMNDACEGWPQSIIPDKLASNMCWGGGGGGLKCISARNIFRQPWKSLSLCLNISHCCCFWLMFLQKCALYAVYVTQKSSPVGCCPRSERALPCMQFISSCITHITWHPITTPPPPHTIFFFSSFESILCCFECLLFVFQSCMLIWWLSFHFFSWCLVCWLHHGWNGPG